MPNRSLLACLAALVVAACTTPYKPALPVQGGAAFAGLAAAIAATPERPADVVLVHGMCSHDRRWANATIDRLAREVDRLAPAAAPDDAAKIAAADEIEVVTREMTLAVGQVRFSALIWSPLTRTLKQQLDYDRTGEPTDCAEAGECKPTRALLNGQLKDGLLNDCLADAMIYQGRSGESMRSAVVDALTRIVEQSQAGAARRGQSPGPLVLVSESLGSKIAVDALEQMLELPRSRAAGTDALQRLALVFMAANQLPLLALADQAPERGAQGASAAPPAESEDTLQRLLRAKARAGSALLPSLAPAPAPPSGGASAPQMTLVAFTDPNDLLSYRLLPSRYAGPQVAVADVLVSNQPTWFGWLARPDHVHTRYLDNDDVTAMIACGRPRNPLCSGR